MLISVVILNWNGAHFLREYLPSVIKESEKVEGSEVVVADNGSTDSSLSLLEQEFGSVRVIALDKNYGFTGGYNRAIREIDSKYIMLLNSDVEMGGGSLRPLIDMLEADNTIGAVMPKILSIKEPQKFEYAGAAGGYLDLLGLPYCRGRVLSKTETDRGQYDDSVEIFWASGAAMVIRRDLYQKVGGLDEDFFLHMEEIDLSWRVQNLGYKIYSTPESKVYHLGGGTLDSSSPRKLYYNFRNSLFMLTKNLPKRWIFLILIRMCFDGAVALIYLITGKFSSFRAVFLAHIHFYKKLSLMASKRSNCSTKLPLTMKSLIIFRYFCLLSNNRS